MHRPAPTRHGQRRSASAAASNSDALLLKTLAKTAERRVRHFNAQELANTAWAFVTANQSDALLVKAVPESAFAFLEVMFVEEFRKAL